MNTIFPATSMPDADWWNALWPEPSEVVALLGLKDTDSIVDLCCGDGLFTVPLARVVRHVVAIDLDPRMVACAQNRILGEGLANCTFVAGDAYDLPQLVAPPCDAVLLANTFHGVPDKVRLACAVATILKPRGRFIVINWHHRPREETIVNGQPRGPESALRMTPEDVASAAAPAGLRPVQCIELPPHHYAAVLEAPPASRL